VAQGDIEHFLRRRHLEIERHVYGAGDLRNIRVGDVPAIFAQMRRYSVGTGFLGQNGGAHGIGMMSTAGVPDGGDMIDIDAQAKKGTHRIRLS
jgi:hypothetical protein